jgi:hypothetical protein
MSAANPQGLLEPFLTRRPAAAPADAAHARLLSYFMPEAQDPEPA